MPIYEYRCASCGHELEALQKLSDPVLTQCPACHAEKLTKLVSAAGFQLKGSGWYATDFRNPNKPAATKQSGDGEATGSEAKADSKSEASTDSAPETKPPPKSDPKSQPESESKSDGGSSTKSSDSAASSTNTRAGGT